MRRATERWRRANSTMHDMTPSQSPREGPPWHAHDGAGADAWRALTRAQTLEETAAAWAAIMRDQIDRIDGIDVVAVAALRRHATGGRLQTIGVCPVGRAPPRDAIDAAEAAMEQRKGVARGDLPTGAGASGSGLVHAAAPLMVDDVPAGAVLVEMRPATRGAMQQALRQLQWGGAWIRDRLRAEAASGAATQHQAAVHALNAVATVAEQVDFPTAARAACTDLATRFACDRVSLGFRRRRHARVMAISHSAQFSRRMQLSRALAETMDEAIDQRAPILWPDDDAEVPMATRAARALCEAHGSGHVYTVPLYAGGLFVGALVFERDDDTPFSQRDLDILEAVTTVLAPVLEEKRRNDRWLVAKAWGALVRQLGILIGPGHLGRKLAVGAALALVAFFSVATTDFEISADARVVGQIEREIAPGFDGIIAEVPVVAGDRVAAGDLLVRLDDRDLALERLRLLTERQSQQLQYDEAVATRDRAEMRIRRNRIEQAETRIELIDARIARTRLTAPFDALVISGDLDQSLGTAVSRGETLMTLAPADAYEVTLQVEERHIDAVAPGQTGALRVTALPARTFPITIDRITPVASYGEGLTTFAVDARLDAAAPELHPGMEGVGRIAIEERLLIDVWTRPILDWFRLTLWRHLPV